MKTEWNGGKNPVRKGETCVTVWLRDGKPLHGNGDGSCLRWSHEGNAGDIIAYEVAGKPQASEETLRDRVAMAALPAVMAFAIESVKTGSAKADMNEHSLAKAAYAIADAFMAARGEV